MPCSLKDYQCQDEYFTNYMKERYGSWTKAKQFWQCTGHCVGTYGKVFKKATWW